MEPSKRELRQEKREIKRAGGKRRRRLAKEALAARPEEAPWIDAEFDFGRHGSSRYNGMDRDPTRRRTERDRCRKASNPNGVEEESAPEAKPA